MLARWNELSDQLSRLNRGPAAGRTAPPNPGSSRPTRGAGPRAIAPGPIGPRRLAGRTATRPTRRRSTRRISTAGRGEPPAHRPDPPAAVVSDRFTPTSSRP